jgi:hypothetical protein
MSHDAVAAASQFFALISGDGRQCLQHLDYTCLFLNYCSTVLGKDSSSASHDAVAVTSQFFALISAVDGCLQLYSLCELLFLIAYLCTSLSKRYDLNYQRISHSILSISRGLGPT